MSGKAMASKRARNDDDEDDDDDDPSKRPREDLKLHELLPPKNVNELVDWLREHQRFRPAVYRNPANGQMIRGTVQHVLVGMAYFVPAPDCVGHGIDRYVYVPFCALVWEPVNKLTKKASDNLQFPYKNAATKVVPWEAGANLGVHQAARPARDVDRADELGRHERRERAAERVARH